MRHTLFTIQDEHLRQMLQALLIDRFRLKFHRDMKTGSVLLLKRSGKALQLTPVKTASEEGIPKQNSRFGSIGFAGKWVLTDTTMPQLAKFASDYLLHRPVIDNTGLTGSFNYQSALEENWDTYESDQTGSFMNMISEAGLKLKSGKGPIETFVIEHAELPSEN